MIDISISSNVVRTKKRATPPSSAFEVETFEVSDASDRATQAQVLQRATPATIGL